MKTKSYWKYGIIAVVKIVVHVALGASGLVACGQKHQSPAATAPAAVSAESK